MEVFIITTAILAILAIIFILKDIIYNKKENDKFSFLSNIDKLIASIFILIMLIGLTFYLNHDNPEIKEMVINTIESNHDLEESQLNNLLKENLSEFNLMDINIKIEKSYETDKKRYTFTYEKPIITKITDNEFLPENERRTVLLKNDFKEVFIIENINPKIKI